MEEFIRVPSNTFWKKIIVGLIDVVHNYDENQEEKKNLNIIKFENKDKANNWYYIGSFYIIFDNLHIKKFTY